MRASTLIRPLFFVLLAFQPSRSRDPKGPLLLTYPDFYSVSRSDGVLWRRRRASIVEPRQIYDLPRNQSDRSVPVFLCETGFMLRPLTGLDKRLDDSAFVGDNSYSPTASI